MTCQLLRFFITWCMLIYPIHCYALTKQDERDFKTAVLDGKADCKIADMESFLHLRKCEKSLPSFTNDLFIQRVYLPCFGAYEALFGLCEFNLKDNLNITSNFSNPSSFCSDAEKIYAKTHFVYNNTDTNLWSDSLKTFMVNNTLCDSLCIVAASVDPMCITSVTAAHEYLRLKELHPLQNNKEASSREASPFLPPIPVQSDSVPRPTTVPTPTHKVPPLPLDSANKTSTPEEHKPVNNVNIALPASNLNGASGSEKNVSRLPNNAASMTNKDPKPLRDGEDEEEQENDAPPQAVSNIQLITPKEDLSEEENTPLEDVKNETPEESNKNVAEEKETEEGEHMDSNDAFVPNENVLKDHFVETEDSYASSYFATITILCFLAYFLFHYKNKLLALVVEGRKNRNSRSRTGRPCSANYSRLHSNLEEAIASNVTTPSATHVLY